MGDQSGRGSRGGEERKGRVRVRLMVVREGAEGTSEFGSAE